MTYLIVNKVCASHLAFLFTPLISYLAITVDVITTVVVTVNGSVVIGLLLHCENKLSKEPTCIFRLLSKYNLTGFSMVMTSVTCSLLLFIVLDMLVIGVIWQI